MTVKFMRSQKQTQRKVNRERLFSCYFVLPQTVVQHAVRISHQAEGTIPMAEDARKDHVMNKPCRFCIRAENDRHPAELWQ